MPLNQLRKILPGSVRALAKRVVSGVPENGKNGLDEQGSIIETVRNEYEELLSGSFPSVGQNAVPEEKRNSNVISSGYFFQYVEAVTSGNSKKVDKWQQDHPTLSAFCDQKMQYLDICDNLDRPVSGVLRRLCYVLSPFLKSQRAQLTYSYKSMLPRVGLIWHINPVPSLFLKEAFEGEFVVDDLNSESIIQRTWKERSYEYLSQLKSLIADDIEALPDSFIAKFPGRDWLIEQVTYNAQAQIGFRKLLNEGEWDVLVVGAMHCPLGLTLLDVSSDKKPPVIYVPHGFGGGVPSNDLFARADYVAVRGNTERRFYEDTGYPPERIFSIGSMAHEEFPSRRLLEQRRQSSRLELGLEPDRPVIVYALIYDIDFFNMPSLDEQMRLILDSLKLAVEKHGLKNPVLYLKYHPAPTSDPGFSYSRNNYPLRRFMELKKHGFSVRLLSHLKDCLPAADCMIIHESSVLLEAVSEGIPTVSITYKTDKTEPLMGKAVYEQPSPNRFLTRDDSPETIAGAIAELVNMPKDSVHEHGFRIWNTVHDCGRTEGMIRMADLVRSLLPEKKQDKQKEASLIASVNQEPVVKN